SHYISAVTGDRGARGRQKIVRTPGTGDLGTWGLETSKRWQNAAWRVPVSSSRPRFRTTRTRPRKARNTQEHEKDDSASCLSIRVFVSFVATLRMLLSPVPSPQS